MPTPSASEPLTVDPALVERFTRDWHEATGSACADRALIACSGGPDSSALLVLMGALQPSLNPSCAATVDHRLRSDSSAEAGRAADIARRCGIAHAILHGDLPDRASRSANLSARARALRYALLDEHADAERARWIVTAHTADDQQETLVMRLNRGAGVRGLSGVRRVAGRIVRPLLGWRREELAAVVAAAGIAAVNDPSNVDDRFDRARLRKALAGADWLDPAGFARSAAALADADAAIEWAADRAEEGVLFKSPGEAIIVLRLQPREILRRLVERALRHVDPSFAPDGGDLTRVVAALDRMEPTTAGGVAVTLALAKFAGGGTAWVFRPAPPRRSIPRNG